MPFITITLQTISDVVDSLRLIHPTANYYYKNGNSPPQRTQRTQRNKGN
ncbi:MAG: hypothetical protein UZ01_00910 [Candidatus Brocadia sinica]|nr:MAG: hypothetical protein UZ01_00910 [Candidatus Brocadia sinica]